MEFHQTLHTHRYPQDQGRIRDFWIRGSNKGGGGSICAVLPIFPEIHHENEII